MKEIEYHGNDVPKGTRSEVVERWEMEINIYRVTSVHASRAVFTGLIHKELDGSESVVLDPSLTTAGYTGGGTQVREAGERYSSSRRAVGRFELDSLQHNCTNSQSVSWKPRDSASRGFSGRSPLTTAVTGEKARIWCHGRRPVRTWDV